LSNFGDLIRKLRQQRGMTLDVVAREIGSNKGYVSGIETDKVNPPSAKLIRKLARLFGQEERELLWIAWADKAPPLIRRELQGIAKFHGTAPAQDHARIPLLNAPGTGYPLELDDRGRIQPLVHASIELPSWIVGDLDAALIIQEESMALPDRGGLHSGDLALLRREAVRSESDAFILLSGVGSMLRHVVVESAQRVVLQPLNPNHPRKAVRKADIKAFYRVAACVRYSES
jgi:transcriptional regulator with XRE-family HTH domain